MTKWALSRWFHLGYIVLIAFLLYAIVWQRGHLEAHHVLLRLCGIL